MRNKPTREEKNDKPGEIACTFKVWIEPCDIPWEDLVDTNVCGNEPPAGTEAFDVLVHAEYEATGDGHTFRWEGYDSLGGILHNGTTESDAYMEECIQQVKEGAYATLLVEIEAAVAGDGIEWAKSEQKAAQSISIPK